MQRVRRSSMKQIRTRPWQGTLAHRASALACVLGLHSQRSFSGTPASACVTVARADECTIGPRSLAAKLHQTTLSIVMPPTESMWRPQPLQDGFMQVSHVVWKHILGEDWVRALLSKAALWLTEHVRLEGCVPGIYETRACMSYGSCHRLTIIFVPLPLQHSSAESESHKLVQG
jgi:hypothetical protein